MGHQIEILSEGIQDIPVPPRRSWMKIIETVDQEYPRVFPLGAEDGLYLLLSHCPSVDSMGYFGQFASGMHSPWSPSQCLAGIKEVKFSKVSKYTLGRKNGEKKKNLQDDLIL